MKASVAAGLNVRILDKKEERHWHFSSPGLSKTCLFTASVVLPVKYSDADRN